MIAIHNVLCLPSCWCIVRGFALGNTCLCGRPLWTKMELCQERTEWFVTETCGRDGSDEHVAVMQRALCDYIHRKELP